MAAINVSSRTEIAAWIAAQAAAAPLALLSTAADTEAWAYDPNSSAPSSDGFVIIPADAPALGRWVRQSDYVATALALNKIVTSPAPPGSVTWDSLNAELQENNAAIGAAQAAAAIVQDEANALLAQANLTLADVVQKAAIRGTKQLTSLSAEFTKGINKATASITEELTVLAEENLAVAIRTSTVEAMLSGLGTGTGSVAAAISSASTAYVTPLAGVSSTVSTHTAQLSGMGTGTGSVASAISSASTAYVSTTNALALRLDTQEAIVGGNSSLAILKGYATAAASGASASAAMTVKATDGTHTSEAGFSIDAVVSGGVTHSRFRFTADIIEAWSNMFVFCDHIGNPVSILDSSTGLIVSSGLSIGAASDFACGGMSSVASGLSIGTTETDFFYTAYTAPGGTKLDTVSDFITYVPGAALLALPPGDGTITGRVRIIFSGFMSPYVSDNIVYFKVYRCQATSTGVVSSTLIGQSQSGGLYNQKGGAQNFTCSFVDRSPTPNTGVGGPAGILYRAIIYTNTSTVAAIFGSLEATHYKRCSS